MIETENRYPVHPVEPPPQFANRQFLLVVAVIAVTLLGWIVHLFLR